MALSFPGNVIVSAGAGSGKTRVLVEKYFTLLVDEHPDWPVNSVVAITFTRKAASELKARIVKRLLGELETETTRGPRRKRLQQVRQEVGAAPIGTIHNFCGRILREFAFDAHIDPDFVVLEGAQESALRLKAAKETLAEATSSRDSITYQDLLHLLNLMSAGKLTTLLASMLGDRSSFLEPAKRYSELSPGELQAELIELHTSHVSTLRNEFSREWFEVLSALRHRARHGKVADLVNQALDQWPADPSLHWASIQRILQEAIAGLLTTKLVCRSREFKQAEIEDYDPIRPNLEELAARYTKANLADLDRGDFADLERTQRLARLFLKCLQKYNALRGGGAGTGKPQFVDFTDMELMTLSLIRSSAEVRDRLRKNYPYLIIDEFQDTSQSQWDILRPLATDEMGRLRAASLFVVGDKKQGVYGFRSANVTLFGKVQQMVADSNDEWYGNTGLVSMAANFRTAVSPLNFINRVFQSLLNAEGNPYAVDFEALEAMRFNAGDGCVEFLLAGEDFTSAGADVNISADEDQVEAETTEAALVAAHIQNLIQNEGVRAGDIALLFRKRSVFQEYEAAISQLGIPVVSQQGANLFHQPELADLIAALNAVVYPHKDLVFVHFLRSPMIGFSDDLLLKIARTPGRSYYDKACRVFHQKQYRLDSEWFELNAFEVERLSFALELLKDARTLVGNGEPYDIVKFVLDKTGLYSSMASGSRGRQARANLEKLMAVARSAETLTFEEFLEYIRSEEQSVSGMAEAIDLSKSDAVKIMTVHAAKGLEFPVVYLPSLNSGTAGRPDEVGSDGEKWMTLRLPKTILQKPSFLMQHFSRLAQEQQKAEERRVFYVAMTRCELRLILSANQAAKPRGETFYSWVSDEFSSGRSENKLKTHQDFNAEPVPVQPGSAGSALSGFSREARIEYALRLAGEISQTTDLMTEPRRSRSGAEETWKLLIKPFLTMLLEEGKESAVNTFSNSGASLVMGKTADQVLELLEEICRLMDAVTASNQVIVVAPVLRFIVNGEVLSFNPHLKVGSTYVWLHIGDDLLNAGGLHEEYLRAKDLISGAPLSQIWQLPDGAFKVASGS